MRIIVFILLAFHVACASAATLTGRIVRVTDGDTVVILSEDDVLHKVRLQGIDAPARKQAYGAKSKAHLSELLAGRFVVVEYGKKDRHGRIVGKVLIGGQDACLGQVAAGFAWHYKKYQNKQTETDRLLYSEAEDEARAAKRGLWQDPYAMSPWEYRAVRRKLPYDRIGGKPLVNNDSSGNSESINSPDAALLDLK